jgi:hypothetical protein
MFRPARVTRACLIVSADITSGMMRPLRWRCAVHCQDHAVSRLRTGPGSALAILIPLANTGCATMRPQRRCAVHHWDQKLIPSKAGPGSARKTWAVQIKQTPCQRPRVNADTLP